jgi:integrase
MAGVDLYRLKELLGHKDIKATQIYAHLSAEHLKKAAGEGVGGGLMEKLVGGKSHD